MASTATITDTTRDGQPALRITCTCTTCGGKSAVMCKPERKPSRTAVHNLVRLAHGPLGGLGSTGIYGPWKV